MTERPEPPVAGDERETLVGFLTYQRATLEWKCSGLAPEQLDRRASPPSTLSLLGLLRHMAEVEYGWFRGYRREQLVGIYYTPEDLDRDFDGGSPQQASADDAWATWRSEVAYTDEMIAALPLEHVFTRPRDGFRYSLRWLLVHMIEEYARHNGHADLLREAIDGATGE